MGAEKARDLETILDNLYEQWREIRKETIERLGGKEALKIIDFHANNWIDIVKWISSEYKREEQMNIIGFQFSRLFKEVYWLQFLFHTGNYPTAYRNLRYILEMISQAYCIAIRYPTLSLDEQIGKVKEIEKRIPSWNIVSNTLCKVLSRPEKEIQTQFRPLWDDLNKYAHPSARQMDFVAAQDFSALVTDSFNEGLARELLRVTDKVFDLVYATVLRRFPKAIRLVQRYEFINEWQECLPNTMSIIRQ